MESLTSTGGARRGRAIHLLDPENLVGGGEPVPEDFLRMVNTYIDNVGVEQDDLVVLGMSPWFGSRLLGVLAALPWTLRFRSGKNGGEMAAIDAVDIDYLAKHFQYLVIGSGDHAFAALASRACALGMTVWQVSGRGTTSRRLREVTSVHTQLELGARRVGAAARLAVRNGWGRQEIKHHSHRVRGFPLLTERNWS